VIQSGFDKEAKYRVLIGIGILVCKNTGLEYACASVLYFQVCSSPTARVVLCVPDVITAIKSLTSTSGHVKV